MKMKKTIDTNEVWYKAYNTAHKIYKPLFKKQKKLLVKYAKEFQPFDYGFMEKLIFQSIRIYYDFYRNKDLLYQDTNCEFNQWKECVDVLKRCVEIINLLENADYETCLQECELKDELYTLIKDNHTAWWD